MEFKDVKDVFKMMPERFNPDIAGDMEKTIVFEIEGEGGGIWSVSIKGGKCTVKEGASESPSLTLKMSSSTWLDIVNGKTDGIKAFMSGRLKFQGDIILAQQIEKLFGIR